jgi:hypothetical protein
VGEHHRPLREQRRQAIEQPSQRDALGGSRPAELPDPAARLGGEVAGVGPPRIQLKPGGRQPAEAGQQLTHGQGDGRGPRALEPRVAGLGYRDAGQDVETTQGGSASRSASRMRGMAMPASAAGRRSARITGSR